MGSICFSKPFVDTVQRYIASAMNPQRRASPATEQPSNYFSRTANPTSSCELSVTLNQPPSVQSPSNGRASGSFKREKLSKNKRRSSSAGERRNGCRLTVTGASLKQPRRDVRGSKMSLANGGRASAASDTGSTAGLMNGFYALATMTAYEANLIPEIWIACINHNQYFCEHVLSRLFSRYPDLQGAFDRCPAMKGRSQSSHNADETRKADARAIISEKAKQLFAFMDRLITVHKLEYDSVVQECDQLGRTHAPYFYDRRLQPCHWDALAYCIIQEYRKTQMNSDLSTDEKELQLLSWTHFTTAVTSAIKEAFAEAINTITVPNTVD